MKIEKYHLKSDSTLTYFEFISIGTKGAIRKIIEFQTTSTPGLYNLAFGDKHPADADEIDDLAISNNGDTKGACDSCCSTICFLRQKPGSHRLCHR